MPLYLWDDAQGERYHASYFDMYRHGPERGGSAIWRHGDWIRLIPHAMPESGTEVAQPAVSHVSAVIYGRSDATINRHGCAHGDGRAVSRGGGACLRCWTAWSSILNFSAARAGCRCSWCWAKGLLLDDMLQARLRGGDPRDALSPRQVPSTMHQVAAIPRTLSGKKMELPVKTAA